MVSLLFTGSYTSFCAQDSEKQTFEASAKQACRAANQNLEPNFKESLENNTAKPAPNPPPPRSGSTMALVLGTLLVFGEVFILNVVTNFI